MLLSIFYAFIFLGILGLFKAKDPSNLEILGIEPNSGPLYGKGSKL